ncbi:hypothetical protein DH2020_022826 [Rehmannia glutinosa]|uniref:Uncharacterized protein n=1 Tax=Rehmannia glutinosa TaxID=99300 RepID=A0ABR0W498_REHGL
MDAEKKDSSKAMDWKSIEDSDGLIDSSDGAKGKETAPKKIRQIHYYFLPRRSLPSAILFYGTWIAAGIGAGMLTEIWLNKKAKEDGIMVESEK